MITRISMKNFKAHANLELDGLPMITVFVGRNNSGKSSILHAVALPRYGPTFGAAVPIGARGKSFTTERGTRASSSPSERLPLPGLRSLTVRAVGQGIGGRQRAC